MYLYFFLLPLFIEIVLISYEFFQVLRKEMTYKLDGFKDKLEQVIDCVELENEKCDHSGTRSSSSSMVVSNILYLVCFVVIFCTFQL